MQIYTSLLKLLYKLMKQMNSLCC